MVSIFESWLVDQGVGASVAAVAATATGVLVVVVFAMVANLVAKRVLLRAVVKLAARTETSWDDVLTERRVFHRLAHIAPALVIYFFAPAVLGTDASATRIVIAGCLLYLLVVIVSVLDGVLNATVDIVRASRFGRGVPLTSFAQVAKLVLYGVASIVALSVLIGESPVVLLGGLGVMTTVMMLVFQDAILGFVAGIQLSANKMVSPGDWIEMPKYGADGDVLEVALTTVKVQNFDKTITTVPTYALISESFKNWRGMSESGGRRIKRSINIDLSSIRFCDDAMLERLSKIHSTRARLDWMLAARRLRGRVAPRRPTWRIRMKRSSAVLRTCTSLSHTMSHRLRSSSGWQNPMELSFRDLLALGRLTRLQTSSAIVSLRGSACWLRRRASPPCRSSGNRFRRKFEGLRSAC